MRTLLSLFLLLCCEAIGATYTSNGTISDIQAKHDAASDGDIIEIPAGTYDQTGTGNTAGVDYVSVTKGVHFKGASSGRIIAKSVSSVTIGTGSKTFALTTVRAGKALGDYVSISNGDTLRIRALGGSTGDESTAAEAYVEGTVTSYSGGSLTLNVATTQGSGTYAGWIVQSASQTIFKNNKSALTFYIVEPAAASVEVSGIFFKGESGSNVVVSVLNRGISTGVGGYSQGKPTLIHDCMFEIKSGNSHALVFNTNKGVIWNCSFFSSTFEGNSYALHHYQPWNNVGEWSSGSTIGALDTDGVRQVYFEDCDVHGFRDAGDNDNNARCVWRKNYFNSAGIVSHGNDTSKWGVRQVEYYDNEFTESASSTIPALNWSILLRGGTGIIYNNVLPNAITLGVYKLDPSQYGGDASYTWGYNTSGAQYPAPRQLGSGYTTGTRVDGWYGYTSDQSGDTTGTSTGDLDPVRIWGNTGGTVTLAPTWGGNSLVDNVTDYIQSGRDYYTTVHPSWTAYTYPHPLRTDGGGGSSAGLTIGTLSVGQLNL